MNEFEVLTNLDEKLEVTLVRFDSIDSRFLKFPQRMIVRRKQLGC